MTLSNKCQVVDGFYGCGVCSCILVSISPHFLDPGALESQPLAQDDDDNKIVSKIESIEQHDENLSQMQKIQHFVM